MIAAYASAGLVDEYVAAGQRKALGLCTKCGGVFEEEAQCPEADCPKRKQ